MVKTSWLTAPNITATHGFSTRHNGISTGAFSSLNLGGADDLPVNIAKNRSLALAELGLRANQLSGLKQVHGTEVVLAKPGWHTADAQVSNEQGIVLVVSAADCYPILFHDPVNKVIGAAHAGWKGTIGRIAQKTILAMQELGAQLTHIQVAIGQGICRDCYEVSEELITDFRGAGFPEYCFNGRLLDLKSANSFVLEQAGILPGNIWLMNRCTTEPDFFSYRRDKGVTGRMWGLIAL